MAMSAFRKSCTDAGERGFSAICQPKGALRNCVIDMFGHMPLSSPGEVHTRSGVHCILSLHGL